MNPTFSFDASTWLHSTGKWVFITVPEDESDGISHLVPRRNGFGSVRVEVQIGDSIWRTSVFPDSKTGCYVLPIKKPIRLAECIELGQRVELDLTVLIDR